MTPTPGGQPNTGMSNSRFPKFQSSQQPGNEPGGANGMYGRFGQTPGQQPSQGFRQKVDGMRRGFGGRQQRGGMMRQSNGMGQMMNRADVVQPQQNLRSMEGAAPPMAITTESQPQQPMQQPDYGRFAPGPASGAMEARAVAPVENTQNMGGMQTPVAMTTQAQPSQGFSSPFGNMRFGAPPAQTEAQIQPDDTQPRDTFTTGPSSLMQPLHSLEGQSKQRQRNRFGFEG